MRRGKPPTFASPIQFKQAFPAAEDEEIQELLELVAQPQVRTRR